MHKTDPTTRKWTKTEGDERAVAAGCRFDEGAAEHVVTFFRRFLRHSKGVWAGQPFELMDWQRNDLIMPLFGWKRADGTRRYRQCYCEIPKKMGKSSTAAGIGLYLLVADAEPGAEVYSVATDRKQASIVHGEACRMVKASPDLRALLTINETTRAIKYPDQQSIYQALSAEHESNEGLNAHGILFDELHAQRSRRLWDTLRYATAARRQPLLFCITTAGDDMTSICREQHDYARGILDGTIEDESFFALIYAADPADDWTDPATWQKANPSLGVTVTEESFAADCAEAQKSPAKESSFRRYRLNIWSTSETPWLKVADWTNCYEEFTEDSLVGRECCAGLDLSKTRDTTALCLVFPDGPEHYLLLPYFWLPEATADEQNHVVPWRTWQRQGFVELTPGEVVDYAFVRERFKELAERFTIKTLAYDPYNAEHITQEMYEETGIERVSFGQTVVNFASPTAEFERLVIAGGMRHNGHPIMQWQIGNANVRTDANQNKRPIKAKPNDHRKVDGVVAAIMALAMSQQTETGYTSVYEQPGNLSL